MTKKFIILCGRYRFFSSLSFYHGSDMFLATRDALVINGSYPGFLLPHVKSAMFRIKTKNRKTCNTRIIPKNNPRDCPVLVVSSMYDRWFQPI